MTAKIRKPMNPMRTIPAPAIFDTWRNSSVLGVLASFSTRM